MSNYIIEGGFDFYKELYESLDNSGNHTEDENVQVCLITNMPLIKHFVELECKHTFNYIPLFKDLVNHKTKFSSLDSQRLRMNEIRCPYCRNKQNSLLPYIEELDMPKQHGVNWINLEAMSTQSVSDLKVGQCSWGDGHECNAIHVLTNGITNMDYCYYHYKQTCKKLLMEQKEAKKAEALKQKQEVKAFAAQQKMEAKQKLLEEKALAKAAKALEKANNKENKKKNKQNKKNDGNIIANTGENVVLTACAVCQVILKGGPRKGEVCGGQVKQNNCCARHGKIVEIM
jgi:hypothetical protein